MNALLARVASTLRSRLSLAALLLAAALAPSSLAAQEDTAAVAPAVRWQRIYSDEVVSIWIDTQTVRYESDTRLRVWTEWRYERVQTIDETGRRYDSVKIQDDVHCETRQYRTRRANFYYGSQSLGLHEIPSPTWREPVPESMAESLVEGVCFWAGF